MKKIFSLCALLICGFALQACTPAYKIDTKASKNLVAPAPVLKASDKILLVTPADGKYKKNTYPKSGAAVADKLNVALRQYTSDISTTEHTMTLEEAKTYAKQNNLTCIIYPEITNWEDRVTAVSGKRDRVSVHMIVFDVNNNKIIDDCIIYGNGSANVWATAKTPDILLDKPFGIYVTSLFEGKDKK